MLPLIIQKLTQDGVKSQFVLSISNYERLLKTESSTFGDMIFEKSFLQKEIIADQLQCYSAINVGINTVVPYSEAFDWLNPNLKHYQNFYEFRKNEFSFPAPSKKIRIPPAFLPTAKEPAPKIKLQHVPKENCNLRPGFSVQSTRFTLHRRCQNVRRSMIKDMKR